MMSAYSDNWMRTEMEEVTAYVTQHMRDAIFSTEAALQYAHRTYGINLELRMVYAGGKRGSTIVRLIVAPATLIEQQELGNPPNVDIFLIPGATEEYDQQFVSAIAMWLSRLDRHMRGTAN